MEDGQSKIVDVSIEDKLTGAQAFSSITEDGSARVSTGLYQHDKKTIIICAIDP